PIGDRSQPARRPRRPTDEPVDLVAEPEQMLREVAAVLTGDAGDQSGLHRPSAARPGASIRTMTRRLRRSARLMRRSNASPRDAPGGVGLHGGADQVLHELAAARVARAKNAKRRRHPAVTGVLSEFQCGMLTEHKRGKSLNSPRRRRFGNPEGPENGEVPTEPA